MTATLIRVATASLKSATKFTAGTGFTYALCYELDEILEKEGKQPYFVPGMRRVVASTGMEDHAKAFLNRLGIKDKVNPEVLNSQIDNVSDEDKKVFEAETKVSWDEYVKLHKSAEALKNKEGKTISDLIDKNDPFGTRKNK